MRIRITLKLLYNTPRKRFVFDLMIHLFYLTHGLLLNVLEHTVLRFSLRQRKKNMKNTWTIHWRNMDSKQI